MKGTCAICLSYGELSYEHVPPRRVFNDKPAVAHTLYGLHEGSKFKKPPTLLKRSQGLGQWTLCESCNGKTGNWYGAAFADWTQQCLQYAERLSGGGNVLLPFSIRPLEVLKQIVVMALAVAASKTSNRLDRLRAFVLSRQAMGSLDEFVIRTYFNPADPARAGKPLLSQNRLTESCAVLDVRTGTSVFVIAEVAFPPMGYVVYAATDSRPVSPDFTTLCDLRPFGQFFYGQAVTRFLQVPIRYPFGPVPGYYPNLNKKNVQVLDDDHVLLSTRGR
jgi:hypothetical protein